MKGIIVRKEKERPPVKLPHVFAILFCVLVLVSVLTYLMPAGEFTTVTDPHTGREIIDPDSYTVMESTPVSVMGVFSAIPKGFEDASLIVPAVHPLPPGQLSWHAGVVRGLHSHHSAADAELGV